jgi:hypothetical protein
MRSVDIHRALRERGPLGGFVQNKGNGEIDYD